MHRGYADCSAECSGRAIGEQLNKGFSRFTRYEGFKTVCSLFRRSSGW